MYINFSQIIESTYYSIMKGVKIIIQDETMEIRNLSVEIPFTLDVHQNDIQPMERIQKYANSCSEGLTNQHEELSCLLTLRLKRRRI